MTTLLAVLLSLRLMGIPATVSVFSVSAYINSGGAYPYQGLMTSGQYTREGVCACGPSYPFGTMLLVNAKWYICMDQGSMITDGHVDLWMPTKAEALMWGRRTMLVVVVK